MSDRQKCLRGWLLLLGLSKRKYSHQWISLRQKITAPWWFGPFGCFCCRICWWMLVSEMVVVGNVVCELRPSRAIGKDQIGNSVKRSIFWVASQTNHFLLTRFSGWGDDDSDYYVCVRAIFERIKKGGDKAGFLLPQRGNNEWGGTAEKIESTGEEKPHRSLHDTVCTQTIHIILYVHKLYILYCQCTNYSYYTVCTYDTMWTLYTR